jgi:radical SAM protein with 4Fe4S-binding SPASM domain
VAYFWERLSAGEKDAILAEVFDRAPSRGPRVVELNWQDRCNIDCFFCSTAEVRSGNHILSSERLHSLFDEMAELGTGAVRLAGGGEPLFRRDAAELIDALGQRKIRVTDVTTNGVLLTERVLRALFSAGCDQLTISINTSNPGSYAEMMQTAARNFERVVENVKRAVEMKAALQTHCAIRLQFLIYEANAELLPEMYDLFLATGADRFWFNGLYPVSTPLNLIRGDRLGLMIAGFETVLARDYFRQLEAFSFWDAEIQRQIAEATVRVLKAAPLAHRVRLKWKALTDRDDRAKREVQDLDEYCLVGWYSTTINANGDVVPCCILQDRRSAVLGNLNEAPLGKIWKSDRYERFRAELREIMARRGAINDFSRACVVEGQCAAKGVCPNRSFYWNDDVAFRRLFHENVLRLVPASGEPFAALSPGPSPSHHRLPVFGAPPTRSP